MNLRVEVKERGRRWFARARDATTGAPFGIECAGDNEGEARARLTRWLDWQADHVAALEALQQAEHAYHRTIAESAFAGAGDTSADSPKTALDAVERARVRLDAVRTRKPE